MRSQKAKKRRRRSWVKLTWEWLIWYGLKIGLTYDQALDIPVGELMDYVAIEQVKHEWCIAVDPGDLTPPDEQIIPDVR